jgi:cellulose biosynthesis protein BcsQ
VYDCPPDISPQISDNILNPAEVLKTLKGFRVGHLNITSLVKHVDELRVYMRDEPFDILSINESRLDSNIARDTVGIQGYDMVDKHRNLEGGGVALYYRNTLNVINRTDLVPAEVEVVCLEVIKPKSKPMFVVSVYRPPNSSIELFEKIETLFQNLDNERKELILVGDLNCDFIKNAANNQTKRLIDLINVFQLTQLIKEPTRAYHRYHSYSSRRGHCISKPDNICRSGVLHIGISDHILIYVCRKISFVEKEIKTVNVKPAAHESNLLS